MSQQVPFDNNGLPLGSGAVAPNYTSQEPPASAHGAGGSGGGFLPPSQGAQNNGRNKTPLIDPIESARLTPQVLFLLIATGIKRHWKWSVPMGLVLGLITAGILYLLSPIQYGATAYLQIQSVKPSIIYANQQQSGYDQFANTQIALMKSPIVLNAALEMADVAKLPAVLKRNTQKGWLAKRLRVAKEGRSEYVTISLEMEDEIAAEKIVNAVMDSYLSVSRNNVSEADRGQLSELAAERRRMQTTAQTLQESIRAKNVQVASQGAVAGANGMALGLGQEESIARDVLIEDAKLTALQAARKASDERRQTPQNVPLQLLAQMDTELGEIGKRREELLRRRASLTEVLQNAAEDPRVQLIDRQLKEIDARLSAVTGDPDGSKRNEMQEAMRSHEEVNAFLIDQQIREQEIYVQTLIEKYNKQLQESSARTANIVDVSFDQAQLDRANRNLGIIEERILILSSNQRAPEQIIAVSRAITADPNWQKQIVTVGGGAAMLAILPLLLSIVVERSKPRLYHVSQVRRSVPHVLLGEIMEPPVSWIHGATFRKRLARYRESVHNWCTHLLLSDPFRSCRTLSVASVAGDDGKTFLAVQIAVAMAQMKAGNVLLIDGDMRVGRLHLLFGNEEAGIGLADVLSFRCGFGEAMVQNEKEPNLHLLSAGQLDVSPYELLGDGRFRELLDMLEQNYSLILVVLPPVSNAAESLIMASSTDSTLLCVRQKETVLAAMEDVYRKLVNTGASVDGIVVKDIPYYQMAGKDGGFADKLEQIRLSHLLQYAE